VIAAVEYKLDLHAEGVGRMKHVAAEIKAFFCCAGCSG